MPSFKLLTASVGACLLMGSLVSLPAVAAPHPAKNSPSSAGASGGGQSDKKNVNDALMDYDNQGAIESDEGTRVSLRPQANKNVDINPLPSTVIARLDQLASQQNYVAIQALLATYSSSGVSGATQKASYDGSIKIWLERHANAGDVMSMWLLSDRLSHFDPAASIFWSYAALFATQQERTICTDKSIDFAADILSRRYSQSLNARRANPWILKQKTTDALVFLRSLDQKQAFGDPTLWLCKPFAEAKRVDNMPYTYDFRFWAALRARERNRIRQRLQLDLPKEVEPAVPAAPARSPSAPENYPPQKQQRR